MPTASSRTTGSPSSPRGAAAEHVPPALRALAEAGWSLASRAPSARVGLARAAGFVDRDALPGAIREPVMRELETARAAACEPLAARTVERALKDAWGRAPDKVLDDFDSEPLAVRAAAQTHRGVAGGRAVAIRVRRPGLARSLRADLALLDTLAAPLRAALPRADARALLRAVREQALDEADFEHEASTHRRVARVLRDVEGLVVPRVHGELCSEGVFVADLLDGETLADGARPQDPNAAARTLVAAHVVAARAGLALLDARPGHVIVLGPTAYGGVCPGGGVGLLGAGLARPVGRDRVALALAALAALRGDDAGAFAAAVAGAGVLPAADAESAHRLARTALGPLASGRATLDASALRAVLVQAADAAELAFALVPKAAPHPDDVWLGRAAGQLVATLARLGAGADWPALVASSAGG
jgi:predicted unusual protein kinase regulating ubiquinone biosynthesis (AarF/ABC1/UbiB family)